MTWRHRWRWGNAGPSFTSGMTVFGNALACNGATGRIPRRTAGLNRLGHKKTCHGKRRDRNGKSFG